MRASRIALKEKAGRMVGQPVCVELVDGSLYVGRIAGVRKGELLLAGREIPSKPRSRKRKGKRKARVSGFFPGETGSLFGGFPAAEAGAAGAGVAQAEAGGGLLGGLGGLGGLAGIMGFIGKAMPIIRMGMSVVKTIMPLFKGSSGS
ncbi:hypothetical protein ACF3MZ_09520 [Paenibacillaceae bacterium WGS1546]|uniref:hypothetical protein n=1 Tax=Cohnella sp. WGS1546 TaxID=3366810 RepID=UPI00372D0C13